MVQITNFASNRIFDQRAPGTVLKLGELWADNPTLLLFFRRLGCPICRNYAKTIQEALPEFEKKGVRVVGISFEALGEGSDSDRSFEAGKFWTGELYTIDKSVYTYVFGKKSIFGIFDIEKDALKQVRQNKISGNFKGDGLTLGGQIIVAPPNRVVFEHKQKRFGDDATVEEILAAIAAIAAI